MSAPAQKFDLAVIGAGINGAGIARDAAGRGLSVLLVEQDDIAAAHVAVEHQADPRRAALPRALRVPPGRANRSHEREVVLHSAPHLVAPLAFVLPHEPHLRPAWMIRAGLFLYDHLGRRETLPGSFGVKLVRHQVGRRAEVAVRQGLRLRRRARGRRAPGRRQRDGGARGGADVRVRTALVGARARRRTAGR